MPKMCLRAHSAPPGPLAGFGGRFAAGMKREGRKMGREGKGQDGRRGEGRRREGKGREGR